VNDPKPIVRRPKAAEDVEGHAMYIASDNVEAALRFLDRAEQTINNLAVFPSSGAPFRSQLSDLHGMRTKLVKDFPNHVVFYVEREEAIEIVRVLRGGQNMDVEIQKD
jgi:plasmid stabilization system protein ParE